VFLDGDCILRCLHTPVEKSTRIAGLGDKRNGWPACIYAAMGRLVLRRLATEN
jgi:hypothetical protein